MKKQLFILMLLSISTLSYAQEEIKYVVGIETSTIFRSYKNNIGMGWNYSYGVNMEYPIGQFSLGAAILQTNYGKRPFLGFTGESYIRERDEQELFEFYKKEFSLDYITLSNRLQYRLPCNCVYIHVGYNVEILTRIKEKRMEKTSSHTGEAPYSLKEEADLKKINTSIEVGFGVKMQMNETLRIFMRPTYTITRKPSKNENRFFHNDYHYLRIAFGFQLGIK